MDLQYITAKVKAIEQLERYAMSDSPTLTISNMERFSVGFRDRLADFFLIEMSNELDLLTNDIKNDETAKKDG